MAPVGLVEMRPPSLRFAPFLKCAHVWKVYFCRASGTPASLDRLRTGSAVADKHMVRTMGRYVANYFLAECIDMRNVARSHGRIVEAGCETSESSSSSDSSSSDS